MSSLRWGRVAAIHPEDYSVDLVMTDDGSRLAGVQVLAPFASSNAGFNDLAQPATPSSGEVWDLREETSRDVIAAVAFFDHLPVVIGFRYPQVCQMLFKELERRVSRHASDVYSTIDAEGNAELYHPSGTFLRIGTSPAHEDLTGKDADGRWKIARNVGKSVHLQVTVANAGGTVASLNIDPSGNVTLTHVGNLSVDVGGSATVNVVGTTDVTSGGAATVTAPSVTLDTPQTTCTGNLTVQGAMNVLGNGASGAVSTFEGTIRVNNGDVEADLIKLKGHGHMEGDVGGRTSDSVP